MPRPPTADPTEAQVQRLQSILLAYLHSAGYPCWPGADGLMLDDAIGAYPHAAILGLVPELAEICRLHPDVAAALPRLFPKRGLEQ